MKKVFAVLAAVVFTVAAWAGPADGPAVSEKAIAAFEKEFKDAKNASWFVKEDISIVTFQLNNEKVRAWFSSDGNLEALQRDINAGQMTFLAAKTVAELAAEQTVTSISELSENGELYYVVKTESKDFKFTYKVTAAGDKTKLERKKNK